ncbi:MAG: hypothetical protein ACFFBD_19340, partial [Candidatus Hodarchaeota archaeon]
MLKNRMICLLVIGLVLGLTMGSFTPVSGITLGGTAIWRSEPIPYVLVDFTIDLVVTGQTSTRWIVDYELDSGTFTSLPLFYVDSTEKIAKNESLGGFPLKVGGGYWALWIIPRDVSATSSFRIDCDLTGLPMCLLLASINNQPPLITDDYVFDFVVETGRLKIADTTHNIWFFESDYLDLYYDNSTGILLKAVVATNPIILSSTTLSGTESFDGFTADVLVVPFGVFILGTVLWRKRKTSRD